MNVPKAIDLLKQVIKLHSGHIDGTIAADQTSMKEEMRLLEDALAALTAAPDASPMKSADSSSEKFMHSAKQLIRALGVDQ